MRLIVKPPIRSYFYPGPLYVSNIERFFPRGAPVGEDAPCGRGVLGGAESRVEQSRVMHPVVEEARSVSEQVTQLRRAIHREPELGLDLPLTQRKVLEALQD